MFVGIGTIIRNKKRARDIAEYVIEYAFCDDDGEEVVSTYYVAETSPKGAVKKFKDMFKNDKRVGEIRDVLMVCEGWKE